MCLDVRKPVFGGLQTTKGADKPAPTRSLIHAFVIPFLESITYKLATSDISIFQLASKAEETGGLSVGNPEDRFSCDEAHMMNA